MLPSFRAKTEGESSMLTTYLKKQQTLERYRSGPAAPHLEGFAGWLEDQGYQPHRIRLLIRGVHHFSRWARQEAIQFEELNETALESFGHYLQSQQRLRQPSGNYSPLFVGARHFVTFLVSTDRVASSVSAQPTSCLPAILVEFRQWMQTHRGPTDATLHNYRLPLIDLLETLGNQPDQYSAKALRDFILDRSRYCSVEKAKSLVTPIRMFIRFLIATDRCIPELDQAIPTIARWRLASLPKYLTADAVDQVVASCDLTTLIGVRDRAILLLLARLGFRAGDIVALQLKDLDWQAATVTVSGKSRRQNRLPLPQEVGDAILHYLDHRPRIGNDTVFLTTIAPLKALSYQAVGKLSTRAMQRAGVETPVHGSHVLRYSAATQMLRQGVPLPTIGAVLRHKSVETTMVYAKVDVQLLDQVARPWPEDSSC
jgi:site-specific recombinase XerD